MFRDLEFELRDGERVGLIGANGCGKTTLFSILTGQMAPDKGTISLTRHCKVGYLSQHMEADPEAMVYDEALKVFAPLFAMEEELEWLHTAIEAGEKDLDKLIARQTALHEKYENEGGLTFRSRARSALLGLGFTEGELSQKAGTLSGGQKSKLGLSKLLLAGADFLLLDEPTNHLDITSVEWLEDFLLTYPGAYLVISHDRYFLDKVTNKTVELENRKGTVYKGGFTAAMNKKREDKAALEHRYEVTQREIRRIEGIIDQQRQWNREKNIRTAESKQKSVDRLRETLEKPENEAEKPRFTFEARPGGGKDVLLCKDLSMRFGDKHLFDGVHMDIKKGERVFLLGANGSGKTTLFKMILGQLSGGGTVRLGTGIHLGYYDQTQESLHGEKTALDEVWDTVPRMTGTEVRNAMAAFLFKEDDVYKRIADLSGGEKARVALLKLMLSKVNFLLLDEPTNHLDIGSRETLEQALSDYDGTLLIISHDRYFINKTADKIYVLTPKGTMQYRDYDDYLEKHREIPRETVKAVSEKPDSYKLQKERESARRKRATAFRRCEEAIAAAEGELGRLCELQQSEEYTTDYTKAIDIGQMVEQQQKTIEDLYQQWMTLHEEIERESAN